MKSSRRAASANTQPKHTPAAMTRSISAKAVSGFVRAVRYSVGTPARSHLAALYRRNPRNWPDGIGEWYPLSQWYRTDGW
jgi:hypothetical protein